MAIVAEYKYPHGVVRIDDDCYRGVSEEEMQERIRRLQELAWELRAKREVNGNGKGKENI